MKTSKISFRGFLFLLEIKYNPIFVYTKFIMKNSLDNACVIVYH